MNGKRKKVKNMWQISGTLNEKLGRQVYRAWYVRSLGNGNYLRIKKYYFSKAEKFDNAKGGTYELHLENCKDHFGNVHTCYIDLDTGNPVAMNDGKQVVYSPNVLHEMLNTDDIKAAVKASIGQNYGTLIVIMAAGLGLVIGILLGTNMGAITGAIAGGPTPTPHMVINP